MDPGLRAASEAMTPGQTEAPSEALSVCSDAHCIIDKVALEVPVDVK